jgi:hypothetical protein
MIKQVVTSLMLISILLNIFKAFGLTKVFLVRTYGIYGDPIIRDTIMLLNFGHFSDLSCQMIDFRDIQSKEFD